MPSVPAMLPMVLIAYTMPDACPTCFRLRAVSRITNGEVTAINNPGMKNKIMHASKGLVRGP